MRAVPTPPDLGDAEARADAWSVARAVSDAISVAVPDWRALAWPRHPPRIIMGESGDAVSWFFLSGGFDMFRPPASLLPACVCTSARQIPKFFQLKHVQC